MSNLFISYSRKDARFARKLTEAFKSRDLDFWIDWLGIPPTVDWWREIERGIEGSDIFIFLLSPDSAKSKICRKEIRHAIRNGKRLIPVVVRNVSAGEAPVELRKLNWIFLRETDRFGTALRLLMAAIQSDYVWAQTHRELQTKALEWQRSKQEKSFLLHGTELADAEIQLATNSSKDPYPTDLQREYVFKSRQAADVQKRTNIRIATGVIIALIALTFAAIMQARRATTNADEADKQRATAQAESTRAFNNASTAEANAAESRRQARLSLAHQLVVEARSLSGTGLDESVVPLLATESMKLEPSTEAAQIIQDYLVAHQVRNLEQDNFVQSLALSSDGKYLVYGVGNFAEVLEVESGKILSQVTFGESVNVVAFAPNMKYAAAAGCDRAEANLCRTSLIQVWDPISGQLAAKMTQEGQVTSLHFSSDGKKLVSSGCESFAEDQCQSGGAAIWLAATGEKLWSQTLEGSVVSAMISPDNTNLVTAGNQNIYVWDLAANTGHREIGADISAGSFALSPNGKYIAIGGNGAAELLELASGEVLSVVNHSGYVSTIAFSPDGSLVASGDDLGSVQVWESASGAIFGTMEHAGSVHTVAFSPDGRMIVSGGADGFGIVWDAFTGKALAYMTHDPFVDFAVFTPDGKNVISEGGQDIILWEATTGLQSTYRPPLNSPSHSVVSPDGKYVVSWGCRPRNNSDPCPNWFGYVWNTEDGKVISRLNYEGVVDAIHFSDDGAYLISGGCDAQDARSNCTSSSAIVWQTSTGKEISRESFESTLDAVALGPDAEFAAAVGCDKAAAFFRLCEAKSLRIWNAKTGTELARILQDGSSTTLLFAPDGDRLLAYGGYSVVVWDAATGKKVSETAYHGPVGMATFSRDGAMIAADGCATKEAYPCMEEFVQVWDVRTGEEVLRREYSGNISSVALSPDGKFLAFGACDTYVFESICSKSSVHIQDLPSGEETRLFLDGALYSLTFNSNAQYLLSRSDDDIVRIWEIGTGKEIARMKHDGFISSAQFSPNENTILASLGSSIRQWVWQPEDLTTNACSRITRNLSRAEWIQYIGDGIIAFQKICSNLPLEPDATATPPPVP
jgi:WD40 repeat protein